MCSTYSTNSSSQVLDQSVYPTMQSKKEQQNHNISSLVSYNPCKQFTNVYKTNEKDSPKAMAGNLNSDYPNNARRSENMEYFHKDRIEDVTSQLHDVVMKLQNLNSPKDVYKLEVNESKPQINTIEDMDMHGQQDENMLKSAAAAATACGADVVDFPSTILHPNSNDNASSYEASQFLKEFLKKPKKNRSPKKSPKHRNLWHKTNDQFSNYDADIEIGVEAYTDVPDLYYHPNRCTLDEFITIHEEPLTHPIECQHVKSDPITFTISPPKRMSMSKICMKPVKKFSTAQVYCDNDYVIFEKEDCYSVSPPSRGSFIRKRLPSVTSEDSFVVFGDDDGGDSDCDDESDIADEDDTSSDEDDCSTSEDESILSSTNSEPDALIVDSGQRKVRFADEKNLVEVHVIIAWDFAYRACRKGHWEECVRDRERFRLRILRTGNSLQNIFDPKHRDRIYKERFSNDVARFD
ncbi:PREDICTED: uncharacterized protein LOC108564021 [Nicrophorus vespilloides]|uniref:Uncharacterized protein LOC108564021 n=1 Tax=Nicrophorus vespilloides TaxID=110193 RepID=A0ABM1MUY1_NICVS|nr:PREDICTED: uncharacterized protein LOC108564021 [Nicrophorus vespilloides]